MIARSRFGSKEWQTDVAYHLNGLLEAGEKVVLLAAQLDELWDRRDEAVTKVLAALEVEFFHLSFHERQLRRPYSRLVDYYYAGLDEKPEEKASAGRGRVRARTSRRSETLQRAKRQGK